MKNHDQPFTLRLPFAMADQPMRLEQVLDAEPDRSWAQCLPLLAAFAMSRRELQFARSLLRRKRNLWLFRSNQRKFCGDFLIVDMSSRSAKCRPVSVIELKLGAELKLGGGGAGNQLQRAQAAVREVASLQKVITAEASVVLVTGDGETVLDWILSRHDKT